MRTVGNSTPPTDVRLGPDARTSLSRAWWSLLGFRQLLDGQLEAADASFDRALELQPTHYLTRQFEVQLAVELKDADRLRAAVEAACEVDAPQCDVDVEELISEF